MTPKQETKLVSENKIEYDVCKAHNNMTNKPVDGGTKKQVIAFLKKQKIPYDWDVRACHWDGVTWELSAHYTGDEFLKNTDCLDYVVNHSPKN